jgi:imidazoleglycerol-phosphate dehydratase
MTRAYEITRKTKETDISATLDLGGGAIEISTGIGFFDHMLTAFATHAGFALRLLCSGDLETDGHHSVEDVGIVLGQAFAACTQEKAGLARYGNFTVPMDESIASATVDVGGRAFIVFRADFRAERIGGLETQLIPEFFRAFAANAAVTLHIDAPYGENDHHKCEAIFKAFGHALAAAVRSSGDVILSSKGVL